MVPVIASLCVATTLLVAAALKLGDRTGSAVALTTYGLHGRAARRAVWGISLWELALAAGLLAGLPAAAWAAAGTLAAFALAQAVLVARGRSGLPCGCLGARSRLTALGAARTAALAALSVAPAAAAGDAPLSEAPAVTAAAVLVALLAVRLLTARLPDGALEVAQEGPALGAPTALTEWLPDADGAVRLAVFTSASCRLCRELGPAMERLVTEGTVVLRTYEEEREREVWASVDVPGAPFAVAVGTDGTVLAKGTVNTEAQLRSVVAAAHDRAGIPLGAGGARSAAASSRRTVLARAASVAGAATVGSAVGSLLRPGEADAYHFCGHIYTTDGCPHPTGLPRIDARGRPVRGRDGKPVDDLGRVVDAEGFPLSDQGGRLTDTDGRPLAPAPRTPVCEVVARRFGIRTRVDGAWYRCCGGNVRKLVDCCTTGDRRINGDRALTGYCYSGRKVFCVLYYDTKVPC